MVPYKLAQIIIANGRIGNGVTIGQSVLYESLSLACIGDDRVMHNLDGVV